MPSPALAILACLGGSRHCSSYLGEHWSARGYVAVFLQHPGSDELVWKGDDVRGRARPTGPLERAGRASPQSPARPRARGHVRPLLRQRQHSLDADDRHARLGSRGRARCGLAPAGLPLPACQGPSLRTSAPGSRSHGLLGASPAARGTGAQSQSPARYSGPIYKLSQRIGMLVGCLCATS